MKKLLFVLALGLAACGQNASMKPVQYDYLLNDGNSKVWMIEQMVVDKSNIASQADENKELLIFFENGRFQYIPLKHLGHQSGQSGDYFLDSDAKLLTLYFKKGAWEFTLSEISENRIYLVPTEKSEVEFSVELVPLKHLQ